MTIAHRQAEVLWEGALAGGAGTASSGSGAFALPVTWAARTKPLDGKTSPEQLIAAAHEITVPDDVDEGDASALAPRMTARPPGP
jgi:hypothetical protein